MIEIINIKIHKLMIFMRCEKKNNNIDINYNICEYVCVCKAHKFIYVYSETTNTNYSEIIIMILSHRLNYY